MAEDGNVPAVWKKRNICHGSNDDVDRRDFEASRLYIGEPSVKTLKPQLVETTFNATPQSGTVSALFMKPRDAAWVCVLGHGAGAGMRHPFMESMAKKLAARKVATFRYQFPYMEHHTKRPDPKPTIVKTIQSAIEAASGLTTLPLFLGGKSFGGRMSSTALAEKHVSGIRGVVFLGFPLHPPGTPSTKRAEHLFDVDVPMLFLQGTRDKLAELELLRPICKKLGARATLSIVDGADHSFHVPKKSGLSDDEVLENLATTIADWGNGILMRS